MRRASGLFLGLYLVIVAASGCGSGNANNGDSGKTDSGDSSFRANVVKLVAREIDQANESIDAEESLCLAEIFVDIVGVDDAIAKADDESLLSEKEATAWVTSMFGPRCFRFSEKLVEQVAGIPSDLTSEQFDCLDTGIAGSEYVSAYVEWSQDAQNTELASRLRTEMVRVFSDCGIELPG